MTLVHGMRRVWLVLVLLLGTWGAPAGASELDVASRLQPFVDNQVVAGTVAYVARDGRVASLDAMGFADLSSRTPMRKNHLFWIASMTKPMTGVAVLMLQDEGKLSVEDPVEKYLPEFKGMWLVDEKSNTRMTLKRPARAITVRDLLTHTSGLGNLDAPSPNASLAQLATGYSQVPLMYEPGSKWQYNNGGINTLGRIVEAVSGVPYAQFMEQRIFRPLGMKDTTFWPKPGAVKRLAKSYQPGPEGKGLAEVDLTFMRGGGLTDTARTPYPAGGLFSTAEDVAAFYQMMLDGGVHKGKRLLSEAAVQQMTTTQSGDIKTGFTEGMSWGLGFQVVKTPQGVTEMLSPGTFGHGGAYGTQSWADPKTKTIFILMIQRAKMPNSDGSAIRKAFQEAAIAAAGR